MDWGRQGDVAYVWRDAHAAGRGPSVGGGARRAGHRPRGLPTAAILEIAGPREESLVEAAALVAARRGRPARSRGSTTRRPGQRALRGRRALLPGPDATLAGPTFEEWLAADGR